MGLLSRTFFSISKSQLSIPAAKMFHNSALRALSLSNVNHNNYEGDGKTTVTILNKEHKNIIMVDTYGDYGFRLNNGIFVMGPMAAFPRTVLQWNVKTCEELTTDSFSLFCLLEPKLDLLILGTGHIKETPKKEVIKYIQDQGISLEILTTDQACATFNFLNVEGRCVAGAFIPPTTIHIFEDDVKLLKRAECLEEVW